MRNILCSVLRSMPLAAIIDADGALSAYEVLEHEHADAVIVDINIPLAEKVALLARVKAHFPHIQCVILTATTRNHEILQAAGADKILLREASPQEMKSALFSGDELDYQR
jgi:DNA-binding NarL/FixJ family response regulator